MKKIWTSTLIFCLTMILSSCATRQVQHKDDVIITGKNLKALLTETFHPTRVSGIDADKLYTTVERSFVWSVMMSKEKKEYKPGKYTCLHFSRDASKLIRHQIPNAAFGAIFFRTNFKRKGIYVIHAMNWFINEKGRVLILSPQTNRIKLPFPINKVISVTMVS